MRKTEIIVIKRSWIGLFSTVSAAQTLKSVVNNRKRYTEKISQMKSRLQQFCICVGKIKLKVRMIRERKAAQIIGVFMSSKIYLWVRNRKSAFRKKVVETLEASLLSTSILNLVYQMKIRALFIQRSLRGLIRRRSAVYEDLCQRWSLIESSLD